MLFTIVDLKMHDGSIFQSQVLNYVINTVSVTFQNVILNISVRV